MDGRFDLTWRNKWLPPDAEDRDGTDDSYPDTLGIQRDPDPGSEAGYAALVTDDPQDAERRGFKPTGAREEDDDEVEQPDFKDGENAEITRSMMSHLRLLAKHDITLAKVLLTHGKWFAGRADSHNYYITDFWRKGCRPKIKRCFYNAQMFCLARTEGRYFEGYVFIGDEICGPHAWVVLPGDEVIDFTWEAAERKLRREGIVWDTSEAVYFGVHVRTPEFCQRLGETGTSQLYHA